MNLNEVKQRLFSLQDKSYRDFSMNLSPTSNEVIGVRIPLLRDLAKEIANENPDEFLLSNDYSYFELIFLQGFVIGKIKDYSKAIKYIENHINHIIDWATCDTFISSLKIIKKNKENFFAFLIKQQKINDEFHQRFVSISLMSYYIEDEYLDKIYALIPSIDTTFYYSHMGVAWLIATLLTKKYERTLDFLSTHPIDKKTYNKAIQKALESNAIEKDKKDYLKKLKQK